MSAFTHLPAGLSEAAGPAARRTIPFDYSFRFVLEAEPGKIHTQTVTVSIEAAFTAVSIGYGVIPKIEEVQFGVEELGDFDAVTQAAAQNITLRARTLPVSSPVLVPHPPVLVGAAARVPISLPDADSIVTGRTQLIGKLKTSIDQAIKAFGAATKLSDLTPESRSALVGSARQISVGDLIRALARKLDEENFTALGQIGPKTQFALLHGIRLNPEVAKVFLVSAGNAALDLTQFAKLLETIGAEPERLQFLYALRDEGTGREFQSDFVLNIAGLGISDGDRPFRHFAVPITFAPRSTIRLDVIEKSKFEGELFLSLHGYKVLGGTGTPTGRALRAKRRGR